MSLVAMRTSPEGIEHIKRWEGYREAAYLCSGGKWTVGYGHTGVDVTRDTRVTRDEAERLLRRDLIHAEMVVNARVEVPLTQHQFDALVSFVYNVGADAFRRSTLLRKLNRGDYAAVPVELAKWVHAGGRKVEGLVNRRAAEAGLWVKGSFVSGREVEAAAEPARARDVLATDTGKAAGVVGLAGMVAAAKPALDALADLPPWLGVAVVAAALIGVLVWRLRRDA